MRDDKLDIRWLIARIGDEHSAERMAGQYLDAAAALTLPDEPGGPTAAVGPFVPHGGVVWPFMTGKGAGSAAYADAFLAVYQSGQVKAISEQGDLSQILQPLPWAADKSGLIGPVRSTDPPPSEDAIGIVIRGARWGMLDNLLFVPIANGELISDWFDGSRGTHSTIVADHDGRSPSQRRRAGLHGSLVVQDSYTARGPAVVLNGEGNRAPEGDPLTRISEGPKAAATWVILTPGTYEYTAYMYRQQQHPETTAPIKHEVSGTPGKGLKFWDGTGIGHIMDVICADAGSCVNHVIGDQHGVREVGGHIRTDAPVIMPGQPLLDGPRAYSATPWYKSGQRGIWKTAEERFDQFTKQWRIQYAWPFTDPGSPPDKPKIGDPPKDGTPTIELGPPWNGKVPPEEIPKKNPPGKPGGPGGPGAPGDPGKLGGPPVEESEGPAEQNGTAEANDDDGGPTPEEMLRAVLLIEIGIILNALARGAIEHDAAMEEIDRIEQQIDNIGRPKDQPPTSNGQEPASVENTPIFTPNEFGAPSFHGLPLTCPQLLGAGQTGPESYNAQQSVDPMTDSGFRTQFNNAPRGAHTQFIAPQYDNGTPVTAGVINDGNPRNGANVIEAHLPPDKDAYKIAGDRGNVALSGTSAFTPQVWHDKSIDHWFGGYPKQISGQTQIVDGMKLSLSASNVLDLEYVNSSGTETVATFDIECGTRINRRLRLQDTAETIAAGVITISSSNATGMPITSQSGVADDLDTINGGVADQALFVYPIAGHTITITGAGNIATAAPVVMTLGGLWLYTTDGSNWKIGACCP